MATPDGLMSWRVGEVVESSSTSFVAQCYRLEQSPPLGAFVRTNSPALYAVVCRVSTEPLDAGRPVLARGEDAATEEEVFENNPQLARLLTSRFDALIAGQQDDGASQQFLPPFPPRVHSFIYTCRPEEVIRFTARLDFLRLLLNSGVSAAEEVVGACLRQAAAAHPDGQGFLLRAGKALAGELAGDVPRLNAILRTVVP